MTLSPGLGLGDNAYTSNHRMYEATIALIKLRLVGSQYITMENAMEKTLRFLTLSCTMT